MEVIKYDKTITVDYISIDGVEFESSELFGALEQLSHTKENDRYGDYSLREYDLRYYDATKKLVELGYVRNYTGSRMADLYCIADLERFTELKEKVENLYY